MKKKIVGVVGARPNFMKIAPIQRAFQESTKLELILVHTGQHYDDNMNQIFFRDIGIKNPDYNLNVGSDSHALQTAKIMQAFEPILLKEKPELVVVVGDVNSTAACSLVASKLNIKVAHVEAGLRSFDRTMPEEINRLVTDAISDFLFVTEQSGMDNLNKEGIGKHKIHFVGNTMIDTLLFTTNKIDSSSVLSNLKLQPQSFIVTTIHRPSNVDDINNLKVIIDILEETSRLLKVVFPIHPRTKSRLVSFNLFDKFSSNKNIVLTEPLGYLDFMKLVKNSSLVLTDSGGVQEETTYLGIPCITLRNTTERPVTVTDGTNRLAKLNSSDVLSVLKKSISNNIKDNHKTPHLWDGMAAKRIVAVLEKTL